MLFFSIYSFNFFLVLKEIKDVIPYLSAQSLQVCETLNNLSFKNYKIIFVKVVRLSPKLIKKELDECDKLKTIYLYCINILIRRSFYKDNIRKHSNYEIRFYISPFTT